MVNSRSMRSATIASSNFRLMVRPPNGRLLRASCCVMLLAPSLAEPLDNVAIEGARHAAPIDSAVFVKAGVFAREQRLDEKRRDFLERNLQADSRRRAGCRFCRRHRRPCSAPASCRGVSGRRSGPRRRRTKAPQRSAAAGSAMTKNASTQRQPWRRRFLFLDALGRRAVRAKSFIVKASQR